MWTVTMQSNKVIGVKPPVVSHDTIAVLTRRRWKLYREPRDQWIGRYVSEDGVNYFCPLPTIVIRTWKEEVGICPLCGADAHKTAYMDDGWILGWECEANDGHLDEVEVPWPFGDRYMSAERLESLGYEIV